MAYQPTPTLSLKGAAARIGLVRGSHLLLDNGLARFDAPGLADVGVLGEAVGSPHDVGAQPQLGITATAIVSRHLSL